MVQGLRTLMPKADGWVQGASLATRLLLPVAFPRGVPHSGVVPLCSNQAHPVRGPDTF